ncbi:hypothetical protein [Mariniblastus fucicola]|nr:hypothetical protein [Mariniblastus fucicola]
MKLSTRLASAGLVAAAVLLGGFASPTECHAQKRYNPYHPKVTRIAGDAVRYLEDNPGGTKESAICALAVLEYYKRYDGAVPKDNPMVEEIVAKYAEMIDNQSAEMLQNREVYLPCLVMILLAEYDAEKYSKQLNTMVEMLGRSPAGNGIVYVFAGPGPGHLAITVRRAGFLRCPTTQNRSRSGSHRTAPKFLRRVSSRKWHLGLQT